MLKGEENGLLSLFLFKCLSQAMLAPCQYTRDP